MAFNTRRASAPITIRYNIATDEYILEMARQGCVLTVTLPYSRALNALENATNMGTFFNVEDPAVTVRYIDPMG